MKNVLGNELEVCGCDPMTGFTRSGSCETGPRDLGSHTVCAVMTAEFLRYTAEQGNDLSTPRPEYEFPGLKPGDHWCLCAARWEEARQADLAPPVILSACNEAALRIVDLDALLAHRHDT
jgi:uncharacterized protein (DUF2237 family)